MTADTLDASSNTELASPLEDSVTFKQLTTFLRRMLADPPAAESIARSAYVEVQRVTAPLTSPAARVLLFDTATKYAMAHLKRREAGLAGLNNIGETDAAATSVDPVGPQHLAVAETFVHHCQEVTARLPEPTNQIFSLRHTHRLTVSQIAERLNLQVEAVEMHLTQALMLCRSELEKRGVNSLDPS